MSQGATIKDVAQRAGVSVATASRVLTGNRATSPDSRERVMKAASQLAYLPNAHARSLRSAKSGTVGLLVSDIRNPFFSELAYTIQTELFERGYATLIGSASESAAKQDQYLTNLLQQQIDGVILAPQGGDSHVLRTMVSRDLPLVFVDRVARGLDVPAIDSDPSSGIAAALEDLVSLGHMRVGFVAGPQNTSTGVERVSAFSEQARRLLGEGGGVVVPGGYDAEACLDGIESLMDQGIEAFIFGYGPNTVSALRYFAELGRVIGHDLSVVSFDDVEVFELIRPGISVISEHIESMGKGAVDMLLRVVAGERTESVRLPTTFLRRGSLHPYLRRR